MNYDNARKIIQNLGAGAERRENERNSRDFDSDDDDVRTREREASDRRDREEAADLKAAVEVFGDIALDIAESLNRIAGRRFVSPGHNQ